MNPGENHILAIVVTYYPDKQLLGDNIAAFIDHVDKVLVWENTPEADKIAYRIPVGEKIEYCGDGNNSISRALNYGWRYARDNGFDYLLTMDQDSLFRNFGQYVKAALNAAAPRGIFVPRLAFHPRQEPDYVEIYRPVTSGMLLPVPLLDIAGGYREDFQIDGIDFELCARARRHGVATFQISDSILEHHLGETEGKRFLGKTVTTYNYGPRRLYGIMRNHLIVLRHYKTEIPKPIKRDVIDGFFIKMPIKILLYEDHKCKKLTACMKGFWDGLSCAA